MDCDDLVVQLVLDKVTVERELDDKQR